MSRAIVRRELMIGFFAFCATFFLVAAAFAAAWPACSGPCRQYGPGGGSPNHSLCQACCIQECSGTIGTRTQCLNCCVTDESNPPLPDCEVPD